MNTPIAKACIFLCSLCLISIFSGCATESSRVINEPKVVNMTQAFNGERAKMIVGKFENRSSYMRGIFSDGIDRVGGQAKTILISHLQQTNRFNVLDRDNLAESEREAQLSKTVQQIKGADFVVTGDVTEFGRKEVGDQQLFGILGRGKSQIAYAKVTLNIVNTNTSEVVYSSQGAGEYSLDTREVIGFGGTSSYDSTLTGKVLELAIREAVNNLVAGMNSGNWHPTKKP